MPRASPHRVRPANPALLARPGASLDPTQLGPSFFPLPTLQSRTPVSLARLLSLLPSLSTSCTPRGVAPPLSPSPPPHPPECVLPVPLGLFLPSRRLAWVSLRRAFRGSSGLAQPPPPAPSGRPPLLPPQARVFPAGLGVARLDSAPSANPRTPGVASSPPVQSPPPGHRALGPLLPVRSLARLALSEASALPAGALRAPASPGSCQCGDCAGKHGDRGNDPHQPRPSNPRRSPHSE